MTSQCFKENFEKNCCEISKRLKFFPHFIRIFDNFLHKISPSFSWDFACYIRYLVKLGPHDAWYVFAICNAWMRFKKFFESDTYTLCGNAPVRRKNLQFDEFVIYWRPLHDESHSPNTNIRCISINNHLDEITNHRYPWYVCFDMGQFTTNLANQMWWMNEWHIHSNYTHFFIHTMHE